MQTEEFVKRKFPFIRLFRKIVFFIARAFPFLPGELRALLNKIGGVQIKSPMSTFIGYNVLFDDLFPENISIDKKTIITDGTKILAHFVDSSYDDFDHMYQGKVEIGENVFVGMNVVFVKPVKVGNGSIIGANSVVINDIPPYTIWGGNPAKFLKNREITKK